MQRGRGTSLYPGLVFSHPSEGAAEEKGSPGLKLINLRRHRWTIADGIRPIKDGWEKDAGEIEADGRLVEWTGKVIFSENGPQPNPMKKSRSPRCMRRCRGWKGDPEAGMLITDPRLSVRWRR